MSILEHTWLMANWMKCYLVSQFNSGNGMNIKQTLKQSDFITGNQVNPTGEDKINPAREIMITLQKRDAENEKTAQSKHL